MKLWIKAMALFTLLASATAQGGADNVAGIQLYPGSSASGVEGSEKIVKDTGYKTVACRHTTDSLSKVVAFYRNDKQLTLLGEPSKDNAGFVSKTGASITINSPWIDMKTLASNDSTMICIAQK